MTMKTLLVPAFVAAVAVVAIVSPASFSEASSKLSVLATSFLSRQGLDRSPKRVKLALVGFGRTGTTSLVAALQDIGYTMVHDDTIAEVSDLHYRLATNNITMDEFTIEVGNRGFDGIFMFTDDFIQWAAMMSRCSSPNATMAENGPRAGPPLRPMSITLHQSRPFVWSQTVQELTPLLKQIYLNISTMDQPDKYKDLDTLEEAYDAHIAKVRRMVPKDRLLEFNVKEGWAPLCKFLDKPVPETDFPHINDRMVVKILVGTFWVITWIWPLVPVLGVWVLWKIVHKILAVVNRK